VLDAAGRAKLVALLLDLHCQLTRGRHDQHNGPITTLCTQQQQQQQQQQEAVSRHLAPISRYVLLLTFVGVM
jgi:hypothetical protein